MGQKILFSNLGYAKGINGSLSHHIRFFGRHFYNRLVIQQHILRQVKDIIVAEAPDVCCFVEIDGGSLHSAYHNQISSLSDDIYHFNDISGKYGDDRWISKAMFHRGKSNGFLARQKLVFERLYFRNGTNRLIYKISLPDDITLLFAHFSLNRKTRARQMHEVRDLMEACQGEIILMADFNIMGGFGELAPLLETKAMKILNEDHLPTFTFHKYQKTLDGCLVSSGLAERARIKIIDQPFSDHKALLVEI